MFASEVYGKDKREIISPEDSIFSVYRGDEIKGSAESKPSRIFYYIEDSNSEWLVTMILVAGPERYDIYIINVSSV